MSRYEPEHEAPLHTHVRPVDRKERRNYYRQRPAMPIALAAGAAPSACPHSRRYDADPHTCSQCAQLIEPVAITTVPLGYAAHAVSEPARSIAIVPVWP